MRIRLLYIITVLASLCLYSGVIYATTSQKAMETFVCLPSVDSTRTAVLICDLRNGEKVCSYNESIPLIPASIQKAVTTATLLDRGGKDWIYNTKVYLDGKIRDGSVLEGNILVDGSGDPTLNSSKLPLTSDFVADITAALRRKGIDSIAGEIIVDGSVFRGPSVPASWASGDLPHAYGTGVHGFNFRNNASGKSSVSDPSKVFINSLEKAFASAGIHLGHQSVESHEKKSLIVNHRSAPLEDIMRSCMMRSDNLYAEALLRTLPLAEGEDESSLDDALAMERDFWKGKGADMSGVVFADGSGLSRANRTTARFMTDVLALKSHDPYYASFFPLAGREGTLRNLLAGTPLEEYVAMKTGSMLGIQCYAGYKLDDDYIPTHSIVIIVNGMRGSRAEVRRGVERMLLSIFSQP